MTDRPDRIVRPYTDADHLTYSELSPECSALRALMMVLAETGASVAFPEGQAPGFVEVMVAAGWTLQPEFSPCPGEPQSVLLSCAKVPVPRFKPE